MIDHEGWMKLAATEADRVIELMESLSDEDWAQPTDCTGWNVKAMFSHVLGMLKLQADPAELQRQIAEAARRLEAEGGYRIDHLTALQVEEHASLSTDELVAAFREITPKALAGRAGTTPEMRAQPYLPGPPFVGDWTVGYLLDVIHTRDPWMHRVDASRAIGRAMKLTPDHDGVLIADVVDEWSRTHGEPFSLTLTGPAGGTYSQGEGGECIELGAVEFCRILAGRARSDGLLKTEVAF